MKNTLAVVLIVSFLGVTLAYPGKLASQSANRDVDESADLDDQNDGVVLVLPALRSVLEDDDSVGSWHPFQFDSNPFDSFYTRMQEMMQKLREQMASALANRFGQGGLTPFGKIPEGANTTSTTKIVGDHAVTINETVYSDGDDDMHSFVRVRVIEVKPLNETTEAIGTEEAPTSSEETNNNNSNNNNNNENNNNREELTTQASRSVETVEEFDNEIPKNQVDTLTA